ncbi:MAG: hypothetical protein QM756_35030 [Polyangiaceae bacterium]
MICNDNPGRLIACAVLAAGITFGCKTQSAEGKVTTIESLVAREKRETSFDNGQKREQYLVRRDKGGSYVKDGSYTSFHLGGQKAEEGSFKDGNADGRWQRWDENGKLSVELNYRVGKREGAYTAFNDGRPRESGNFTGDQLSGPYKYFALNDSVVAGNTQAGVPTGTWTITDAGGKLRARAEFKEGKLDRDVLSFAADGSTRPPAVGHSCSEFDGFTLGKTTWDEVVFGSLARAQAFPGDGGIDKVSSGRVLLLGNDLMDRPGFKEIRLVFDQNDVLSAMYTTARKQLEGGSAYASNFKALHAEFVKKYRIVSANMPFVGDTHAEYKGAGCNISMKAPHMSFDMEVALESDDFVKQRANK